MIPSFAMRDAHGNRGGPDGTTFCLDRLPRYGDALGSRGKNYAPGASCERFPVIMC